MSKFRNLSDTTITKAFVTAGATCIAVVLLTLGLAFAENLPPTVFFASLFATLAALTGLFYALHRVSRRPRFMFSLQ